MKKNVLKMFAVFFGKLQESVSQRNAVSIDVYKQIVIRTTRQISSKQPGCQPVLFFFSICSLEGVNRIVVPFMACGDLSGYDADQTYPLTTSSEEKEYQSLSPTQEPINPPYKTACLLKKSNCLASSESMGQESNNTVCGSDVLS